jgi:hypothetical protein
MSYDGPFSGLVIGVFEAARNSGIKDITTTGDKRKNATAPGKIRALPVYC